MGKKLINRLMLMAVVAGSLAACSSGSTSGGSNSGSSPTVQEAPAGPVLYSRILSDFSKWSAESTSSTLQRVGSAGGPTIIPVLGIAIAPEIMTVFSVGKFVYSVYDFFKPEVTYKMFMQAVQGLQDQIDKINEDLLNAKNTFYSYARNQAGTEAAAAYALYVNPKNGLEAITGEQHGSFVTFSRYVASYDDSIDSIAESAGAMAYLNKLAGTGQVNWMATLENISLASFQSSCSHDCYKKVTMAKDGNTTYAYFKSLKVLLSSHMPYNLESGTDASQLFESYNDVVVSSFQANVVALEEAYTMEASINAYNYQNVINHINNGSKLTQIQSLVPIQYLTGDNSYYGYATENLSQFPDDTSENVEYGKFMEAQKNLALMYAARYNTLTTFTMSYIVSDQPYNNFIWPSIPKVDDPKIQAEMDAHPYAAMLKNTISSFSFESKGYTVTIPHISGESNVFYQYSGFGQFYKCGLALASGESWDDTTCPAIYDHPINQSYYDGTIFRGALQTESGFDYTGDLNLTYCLGFGATTIKTSINLGKRDIWCALNLNPNFIEPIAQDPGYWLSTGGWQYVDYHSNDRDIAIYDRIAKDNEFNYYGDPWSFSAKYLDTYIYYNSPNAGTNILAFDEVELMPSTYLIGKNLQYSNCTEGNARDKFSTCESLTMDTSITRTHSWSTKNGEGHYRFDIGTGPDTKMGYFNQGFRIRLDSPNGSYEGMLYQNGGAFYQLDNSNGRLFMWSYHLACGVNDLLCKRYKEGLCINDNYVVQTPTGNENGTNNIYVLGSPCSKF